MANQGNVIESWQDTDDRVRRPIRTVSLAWTSTAGGAVTWTLAGGKLSGLMSGRIQRVVFVPGSGGVQPTAAYSVTLIDNNGIDLLAGQGANLINTGPAHVKPGVPTKDGTTVTTSEIAVDDTPTLNVANAGAAKSGAVILYLAGV